MGCTNVQPQRDRIFIPLTTFDTCREDVFARKERRVSSLHSSLLRCKLLPGSSQLFHESKPRSSARFFLTRCKHLCPFNESKNLSTTLLYLYYIFSCFNSLVFSFLNRILRFWIGNMKGRIFLFAPTINNLKLINRYT